MSFDNLMYALQGLTPPNCENYQGGEDASYLITEEEKNQTIKHRLEHPILPKTTLEVITDRSIEFFGEGKQLPYVVEGINGLEERMKIVSSLSEM